MMTSNGFNSKRESRKSRFLAPFGSTEERGLNQQLRFSTLRKTSRHVPNLDDLSEVLDIIPGGVRTDRTERKPRVPSRVETDVRPLHTLQTSAEFTVAKQTVAVVLKKSGSDSPSKPSRNDQSMPLTVSKVSNQDISPGSDGIQGWDEPTEEDEVNFDKIVQVQVNESEQSQVSFSFMGNPMSA